MIWHSADRETVAKELDSQPKRGLTDLNAGVRRSGYGTNVMITARRRSGFTIFLGKLLSPLSVAMIIVSALSAAANIGNFRAGSIDRASLIFHLVYAGILLLSALILDIVRAARELSANSTIVDIKRNALTFVRVRRNSIIKNILAEELVPGDIIQIDVGDILPADGRLLITRSFMCDERVLTGDDTPVLKDSTAVLPEETPLAERINMAYAGTVAVTGRAIMMITETGVHTQLALKHGKRPRLISNRTPLVRNAFSVRSFGSWLVLCTMVSLLAIYTLGIDFKTLSVGLSETGRFIRSYFADLSVHFSSLRPGKGDSALFTGILFFLTLVLCTVPIGLPQNVMLSIAKGIASLKKDGVMLHRFKKTEIIGCTSVICTDKSGTLTHNRLNLCRAWPAGDSAVNVNEGFWSEDLRYLMRCCTLCCDRRLMYNSDGDVESVMADRTEAAIVKAYKSNGGNIDELLEQYPRCGEIPFDSTRRLMTVIYDVSGVYMTVTKGAPDVLVTRCVDVDIDEVRNRAKEMFDSGLKVIAVAVQTLNQLPDKLTPESIEHDLTFVGLLGLNDPCREDVAEDVNVCTNAGIRTVMITGDHPETAASLARRLRILEDGESVMTGEQLAGISDEELNATISRYSVFARITSEDKVRIIKSWQANGACVLMTAGGMNDAPALHRADISCSAEATATDVAADAADITLSDSSFANIRSMICQGRRIRANLRHLTEFSMTCCIAQTLLAIVGGLVFRVNLLELLPLTVFNLLLFLFVQPCFAYEPPAKDAMNKMPDHNDGALTGLFDKYRACMAGLYILFNSMVSFMIGNGSFRLHASGGDRTGITMAFAAMGLGLALHAFCTRSDKPLASAGLFRNYRMLLSVLFTSAVVILMISVPYAAAMMGFSPLSLWEWGAISVLLLIQLVVWEFPKIYCLVRF
jgi:Cation transport ATPase